MTDADVHIDVDGAGLAGTLSTPGLTGASRHGVLLLGGTFSDLRDADPDPAVHPGIPPHGMYRILARALRDDGWTVLRFDRRGSGASSGTTPDRRTEIADALEAFRWLESRLGPGGRVAVVGESAGAYVAGRIAAAGASPLVAVLQGALASPIDALVAQNAERARSYWERGEDERRWLREHAPAAHRLAVVQPLLADGDDEIVITDGDAVVRWSGSSLAYDREEPPIRQLRHLGCPVLVLHGADDLNVRAEDAFATAGELWSRGNRDVEVRIVPRADHSFQQTPDDPDQRTRERLSFASFLRPFHADYPGAIVSYLSRFR